MTMNRSRLEALARIEAFPCVTMMFPAVGGGVPVPQDPVRLRNALRAAREQLTATAVSEEAAKELLAPLAALLDDAGFWAAPAGGVALWAAPGFVHKERVDFALPELVHVGPHFVLRPLLPTLDRPGVFYVLALSRNRVRLLESGPHGVHRPPIAGLPESFEAAMGELQYDSAVTLHSSSPSALGRRSAIFHGHGDNDEERLDIDLEAFCRRVAEPLETGLPVPEAPVVLAAVAEYAPMFRRAARRLNLVAEPLPGNPDVVADADLAAAARQRVEELQGRQVEAELARWGELHSSGRSIDELEPIFRAADEGRVEALFVAREAERWGSWEPDVRRLAVHARREEGDEDLLDRAVARTLAQGGDARELPLSRMPEGRIAAAILRYAAPA